ncbi:hypothetical protein [uncultured Sphingomonas sp.]|uniref:hypothetical protein n=1 Tax=uncultured Sphingomonas sp. TaxID=158754 RepID=UPI00260293AA|nr:hypothetical protein [uncultured Sphingomonas sp.]
MAPIRKRAKGWFVQVSRERYESERKTLFTMEAAENWARECESRIGRGEDSQHRRLLPGMTPGDLIQRYINEVIGTRA